MKDLKVWLVPIGSFFLVLGTTWVGVPSLVQAFGRELAGWRLDVVHGLLVLIAGAVALWLFFRFRALAKLKPAPVVDEIDTTIAGARIRMAASPAAKRQNLSTLPMVLFLGPSGSTKTTVVTRSGMDAELLAGETHRGDVAVPTQAVNLWYAQGTVVLEAGGRLIEDEARWSRLVRHLHPSRLSAALSRGVQAPRVAVVCFGCDELLKPGASEAVPAAARKLRARLAEVSSQLGTRLPVYVLFTKADRLPYFGDFVRSLSREEAQEVIGTTLPLAPPAASGLQTDQEASRISAAFRNVLHSLSLRRVELLARETQDEVRAGVYEFPREFRKVSDLAVHFLAELCKPSQLGVSPFLRGFYLTGVRAVIVSDPASAPAPAMGLLGGQGAPGATLVFNPRLMMGAAQPAPAPMGGSRKVPEWVFLKRFFRDVLLEDRMAMAVTAGGARVNLLRRALFGSAAALFLLFTAGAGLSYRNNRGLDRSVLGAARGVQTLAVGDGGIPSIEALQRLDTLRAQTERIAGYERDRHPPLFGLGLYQGHVLFDDLRRLYFDRFELLAWAAARDELVASLRTMPNAPRNPNEYGRAYDALKAYLIVTDHPEKSTREFLTPALVGRWSVTAGLDSARLDLVRRNFDFYADELPHSNPYRVAASEALVQQMRAFLGEFAQADQFYEAMVSEASAAVRPAQFRSATAAVSNPYVVPGAFTREGWDTVQASLNDVDRLFERDEWVVGERATTPQNREELVRQLRRRYQAEYIGHWTAYLQRATVSGGSNANEAAIRLGQIADPSSPLLQMFAMASRHTNVDSATVGIAFQPLHTAMPPDLRDRFVTDSTRPYTDALLGVAGIMRQVAVTPPTEQGSLQAEARMAAEQTRGAVQTLSQSFSLAGDAQAVGAAVRRALVMPLSSVEAIAQGIPGAGANTRGADLCRTINPIAGRYPFNPSGTVPASVDDLGALLQPGSGALAQYESTLGDLIVRRGMGYGPKPGATPEPAPEFIAFLNRAAGLSRALFDTNGEGPAFRFYLRPQLTEEMPEVSISVDNQMHRWGRTQTGTRPFEWNGTTAGEMRISARVGGADVVYAEESGSWAVFRAFQDATWQAIGNGGYTVQWPSPNRPPFTAVVTFEGTQALLMPGAMRLNCVSRIVR